MSRLQLCNLLHSFVFAATLVAIGLTLRVIGPNHLLMIVQNMVLLCFALIPVLMRNFRFTEQHKGETRDVLIMLHFTNIMIIFLFGAQLLETSGITYAIVAADALLLAVFAGFALAICIGRPRPTDTQDTSPPLPRWYAAKMLAPIALGGFYSSLDAENAIYAVLAAAGLLLAYLITFGLVWNRNMSVASVPIAP